MGISYDSGRLPFVMDAPEDLMDLLSDDIRLPAPYCNGWTIEPADETWDDIMIGPKITKGSMVVWYVDLNFVVGGEACVTSISLVDLDQFKADVGSSADIEPNCKVIQVS